MATTTIVLNIYGFRVARSDDKTPVDHSMLIAGADADEARVNLAAYLDTVCPDAYQIASGYSTQLQDVVYTTTEVVDEGG